MTQLIEAAMTLPRDRKDRFSQLMRTAQQV
jgi:hypothetical protein